jgi:hypothetical protein
VMNILKRIPSEKFETLRRELYDLLSIAKM